MSLALVINVGIFFIFCLLCTAMDVTTISSLLLQQLVQLAQQPVQPVQPEQQPVHEGHTDVVPYGEEATATPPTSSLAIEMIAPEVCDPNDENVDSPSQVCATFFKKNQRVSIAQFYVGKDGRIRQNCSPHPPPATPPRPRIFFNSGTPPRREEEIHFGNTPPAPGPTSPHQEVKKTKVTVAPNQGFF